MIASFSLTCGMKIITDTMRSLEKNNNMMKNIIRRLVLVVGILFCSSSIMAGHYIKIEKIDASTDFPKVSILLTVSGIDRSPGTLDSNDLIIFEDGSRIDDPFKVIKHSDSENYLYLVFSIDSSKSISKRFLKRIKISARDITSSIGSKDKIAVYQFDDSVVLLNSFSHSTDEIIKNINDIERHGKKTLLYNSIYDSIASFDKVKQLNKKVIVFTDGKDEGSSVSEEDIIQFARNAMIPIYFICCKDSKNLQSMARISKRTGGRLIYSSNNDVTGMYRTVMSVMKNRYTVTYPTKLNKDGMNHRIEVRLKYKDIRDRDSEMVFIEKKQIVGSLVSNGYIITGIIIILLIFLFIIVFYFLHREKRFLKERFEIEKKYLLSQAHDQAELVKRHGIIEEGDKSPGEFEGISGGAWLYQKNGPEIGKKYPIKLQEIIIGSGKDSNVVIKDPSVSDSHSKIKIINGMFTLFDLISNHGTYLNDKKLLRPKALHDWDEIKIGSTVLIFRASHIKSG